MECRFSEVFGRDEAALPRRWGPRENITAVMHRAYHEVAVLLAQLAVIRLDKSQVGFPAKFHKRMWVLMTSAVLKRTSEILKDSWPRDGRPRNYQ